MFSTSTLATATLALAALTSAQYLNQTAPFKLVLSSAHNETLNGSSLFACHEGAAIEGACLAGRMTTIPTYASSFQFNYSDSIPPQNADAGTEGYLTYFLQGANFAISQPMELTMLESSNVAHPIFSPSETGTVVAFDNKEMLNVSVAHLQRRCHIENLLTCLARSKNTSMTLCTHHEPWRTVHEHTTAGTCAPRTTAAIHTRP